VAGRWTPGAGRGREGARAREREETVTGIDRDPDRDEGTPGLGGRSRRRSRERWPLWLGAVILALVIAGGGWLLLRSPDGSGASDAARAAGDTAAVAGPAEGDTAIQLPGLEASDSLVRQMGGDLSPREGWSEWLATEGLVRRFVRTVVSIGAGRSPASELGFLEPGEEFRIRRSGDTTVIDPASYSRYDGVEQVLVSLDPGATARRYRQLRPLFQEAYRELGYRQGSFDVALARAVETLLAVPVPDGPIRVVPSGGTAWEFADPELEALSPAQKHLLRMGPESARRVQGKLRELADALELPTLPGGGAGGPRDGGDGGPT